MIEKELRITVTDRGKDGLKVSIKADGLYSFEVLGLCEFTKEEYLKKINGFPIDDPKDAGE